MLLDYDEIGTGGNIKDMENKISKLSSNSSCGSFHFAFTLC